MGEVRVGDWAEYHIVQELLETLPRSIAISGAVLFSTSSELPRKNKAMLPHMLPTVTVARASAGLFWGT